MTAAPKLPPGVRLRSGRFQVRYYDQQLQLRSRTFATKTEAVRYKAAIETDKRRGDLPDSRLAAIRLSQWSVAWLAEMTHLKPKTRASYDSVMRTHILPALGAYPIGKLTQADVARWMKSIADRGVSGSRSREAYKVLRAALRSAEERQMIRRSPCFGIRLPAQTRREARFLTPEQVRDVAERIDAPFSTLVYLLAYGGLRWGEACALRWRRVDLEAQRVIVAESLAEVGGEFHWGTTKTGRVRTVAVPRFLCELLQRDMAAVGGDPDALVFTGPDAGPLRNNWFHRRIWDPARDAADVPSDLRIHDLRHTCASLLIAQGAHPKMIQAHLGHSTIAVTFDVYGHIFNNDMDALAERLDRIFESAQASVGGVFVVTPNLSVAESSEQRSSNVSG